MNKATRKTIIAGNWKMNMTPSAAETAVKETAALVAGKDGCETVLCVPFVDIHAAVAAAKGTNVKIGAQNVHFEAKGAFTGEIAADMLLECGVEYVIIGHSERRQYFGETDETVNKRTKAALAAGLKVILCLGEVLEERQAGITAEIVSMQTKLDLAGISAEDMKNVIIAYEPVWAIGTGLTATPEQAEEVCAIIRSVLADLYGDTVAQATTIQYGGSMNDANAAELLGTRSFKKLISALEETFDYVIVDAPPLGMVIDCAVIAPVVDGVLMVIDTAHNSYKLERRIKAQLEKSGGKILGVVLNRVDTRDKSGYYGRAYGYGGYGYGGYGADSE